ncbi:MAG: uroporphyrinogen decarboxylase family protein [Candidatus Magnetoovum sp. WYHC-5]|nr:uroporphyrinogen decarboxylase family protein [Candidatus Magnetoovum sp. WYHC-5]
MTGKERVFLTIEGKQVDRRPFVPRLSMYGAQLIGVPLIRYYREPELYAAGQAAVVDIFSADALTSPVFFAAEGEAFGSTLRFYESMPPNIRKMAAHSAKEFLALQFPDINTHPTLLFIRKTLHLTEKRCGNNTAIGAIVTTPVDLPSLVIGIEGWLDALLFQREILEHIFTKTVAYFVSWANALLEEGASFLIASGGFLNTTTVMRELVENTILPVLKEAFSQLKAPIIIHDGGGSIVPFIDLYKDLPNVVCLFSATPGDDLQRARFLAGEDKTLMGGLDGPTLDKFTPAQIYDKCVEILKDRKDDKRFILGTSGPDIPLSTPHENIYAMINAIREHSFL